MTDTHDSRTHSSHSREAYVRDNRSERDRSARYDPALDELVEEPPVPTAKERSCLRCSTIFLSAWAGERVCPRCKSTAAWRAGTPVGTHPSSKR